LKGTEGVQSTSTVVPGSSTRSKYLVIVHILAILVL
jgi:hypothetical protein